MTSNVPAERRRTVVVLGEGEHKAIIRDPDRVDLIDDPEAQFVTFPGNSGEQNALSELLRTQDLLRPGTLAVQSPYDTERYVAVGEAMTEFTVEKFLILTRLAKVLGAKEVTFEDVRIDQKKSSWTTDGSVSTITTKVETEVNGRIAAQLHERLRGKHVFPGSPPDIAGARELLARLRLTGDPQLATLIELRDGDNAIREQEILLNATREASGNINAALRIAGGPAKLKLAGFSSELARQWENKLEVEVRTLVKF
ncbi:hypothetical protein ACOCJ5_07670 [Knoellia sp. CPCC 206450]|uniref:hypothetical protein n=1 Tax=Knoellia tibetensis TaxID=3404798 RepID=UPI003B43514D